jgi:hypothetical protein
MAVRKQDFRTRRTQNRFLRTDGCSQSLADIHKVLRTNDAKLMIFSSTKKTLNNISNRYLVIEHERSLVRLLKVFIYTHLVLIHQCVEFYRYLNSVFQLKK